MFLGPLETILTSRSSQFILVWLLDFLIFFYFSSCWLSCWIEVVVSSFSSTRMDGWRIRKRLPLNTSYFSFSLYRYAIFSPLKETKFEHMLYWNGGPSILFKFWPQSEKIQIRARPKIHRTVWERVNLEVENGDKCSLYIDNGAAVAATMPVQETENESLMMETSNVSQPESLPLSEVGHVSLLFCFHCEFFIVILKDSKCLSNNFFFVRLKP